RMRRVLTAEPHVGPVPAIDPLDGSGQVAPGVTEAVVADLIDRISGVHARDLGVEKAFVGHLTPLDDECAGGLGHTPSPGGGWCDRLIPASGGKFPVP